MSRSRIFWILFFICAIGVLIRSYDLTARSLWFDEAFSWRLIQFPFWEMMARDATDVHPPLYYILLKSWGYVFGSSTLALRLFSVACAGISIVSAYLYGAYAFRSKRAGIYAAVFLALSPWCISYAWEARMYSLGMVFALLSSYALLHGVRDKSYRWFALYGVLAAGLVYTHYYGFFTLAAHALFVLSVVVRSTKWRIGEMVQARIFWAGLSSFGIALLLFSPWLPIFLEQRSQVQAAFWIPPLSLFSVPETIYRFFIPSLQISHEGFAAVALLLLPTLGVVLIGAYSLLRNWKLDGVWLTALLSSIPIAASVVISLLGRSLYNDRYFAFTGIFVFIMLAHVIGSVRKSLIRRMIFIVVIVGLSLSFLRYWNELDIAHKGGAHAAAKYVFTSRATTEPVLVSSPFVYFAIQHYATEEFNAKEIARLYSKTGELSHFSGRPIITAQDVATSQDIQAYVGTVWLVDTTGFTEQPFDAPANWKELSREVFPEVFVHQGDVIVRKFTAKEY